MRFADQLRKKKSDDVLFVFADSNTYVTAGMLLRESEKWGRWFRSAHLRDLGIRMGNCPEFVYLILGALRTGIKVRLLSIRDSKAAADPQCFVIFDGNDPHILNREGTDVHQISPAVQTADAFMEYDWDPEEPMIMMETSGTSGTKRTVQKSCRSIGMSTLGRYGILTKFISFRCFNVCPWFHHTGMLLLIASFMGAIDRHITVSHFNPLDVSRYLVSEKPNIWIGTSSMLYRTCISGETEVEVPKIVVATGETVTAERIRFLLRQKNCKILYAAYGATETGSISDYICVNRKSWILNGLARGIVHFLPMGSVYDPEEIEDNFAGDIHRSVQIEIRDPDENGIGEIWSRSLTSAIEFKDTFAFTGDMGCRVGRKLYITGRKTSLINRSGEKIMPSEIENPLRKLAEVKDAVAFPVPSKTHGEDICLCVVGNPTAEQIYAALPKHLRPQIIRCYEKFPLNSSGKMDIVQMAQDALQEECRRHPSSK